MNDFATSLDRSGLCTFCLTTLPQRCCRGCLEVWRSQNPSGGSAVAISFAVAVLCDGCMSVGGAWYLSWMSQGWVALHLFDVGWEICEPLEREMSGNNPGECVRILSSASILPDFWGMVPWCGKRLSVGFHRRIDSEKKMAGFCCYSGMAGLWSYACFLNFVSVRKESGFSEAQSYFVSGFSLPQSHKIS